MSDALRHLLSVDDLGGRAGIEAMLDLTDSFVEVQQRDIPKVPALRGKTTRRRRCSTRSRCAATAVLRCRAAA